MGDALKLLVIATALALAAAGPALGQVAMTGQLTASKACPAYQSFRNGTNPGGVTLQPGQAYPILGKNKDQASHYLIRVDSASPAERWVEISCGNLGAGSQAAAPSRSDSANPSHVLALGWEPTFCLGHGGKAECARETAQSFEATHLSLHGLWPQPRGKAYCGVDPALKQTDLAHDWSRLPEPDLSGATRQKLAAAMPGTLSGLERHEWIVHGTCFGGAADGYFSRAAGLAEQVNASTVRDVFAAHIGATLSADDVRAAFDKAFGAGAGERVTVNCQGRGAAREISEIVVALVGDVAGAAPLGDLIRTAAPQQRGCPSGFVPAAR